MFVLTAPSFLDLFRKRVFVQEAPFISPQGQLELAKSLKAAGAEKDGTKGKKTKQSQKKPAKKSKGKGAPKRKGTAKSAASKPEHPTPSDLDLEPVDGQGGSSGSRPIPGESEKSKSRSRSPLKRTVRKFSKSIVVPYWKSNKTVGLKIKETGKQVCLLCALLNQSRRLFLAVESIKHAWSCCNRFSPAASTTRFL